MKPKTALITDLDNTLFDWVELWLKCFSPMLDGIIEVSGISKETLIPEIAVVHQKHGTSEYSFLIDELPSLQEVLAGRPATQVFAPAIAIYRSQRKKYLHLFPSVAETLLKIKGCGARIIGYTESMAFYSNYRVRRLGLDGVLDYVFCPREIEREHRDALPELSLSDQIGKESPYTPRGLTWLAAKLLVRDDGFRKEGKLHSDGKIELFYKSVILVLVLVTALLAGFGGVTIQYSDVATGHAITG